VSIPGLADFLHGLGFGLPLGFFNVCQKRHERTLTPSAVCHPSVQCSRADTGKPGGTMAGLAIFQVTNDAPLHFISQLQQSTGHHLPPFASPALASAMFAKACRTVAESPGHAFKTVAKSWS
jgi:hypothetical protein